MAKSEQKTTGSRAPTRQMWRRSLLVLLFVCVFFFGSVIAKLAQLQLVEADTWQQQATAQQLSDSIIDPSRGTIYDAGGHILAESQLVWTIIMSPKNIPDEETRLLIVDEVSALLNIDRDTLDKRTKRTYSQYEEIKKKIQRAEVEVFADWVEEKELTGVFRVVEDYKRVYPYGSLLSTVLGFTGTDGYGLYGLEAEYESVLKGTPGRIVTAQNGWGDELDTQLKFEKTVDATDGYSLVLTIDQTVQQYVEKFLDDAVKTNKCGNRGCAIVMNIKTGAIIAMATKGDFDLNDPMTVADPDLSAQIALLADDQKSEAIKAAQYKQWTNKAITEYYEPGSVFKMFTVSMGLEEGLIKDSDHFYCKGHYTVSGESMGCWRTWGHGDQDLMAAISNSCNPAFFQMSERILPSLFYKYFVGFGFTAQTGIDMLGEAASSSSLYHGENMTVLNTATSAIGQTFKVTPMQMITALSAVANGGYLMQPYVVSQVLDGDGNIVKNVEPTVKRQVISEQVSKHVCELLENVVDGGGGSNAYVAGYRLAGKTGTAEKTELPRDEFGRHPVVGSFGGFAPADDPEYAILLMLDEPNGSYRYGGTIAAPVAGDIMEAILPYLGVEPQYTEEELSKMNKSTPDMVGKEIANAKLRAESAGLTVKVQGDGTTVLKQVPSAGSTIPAGGMVVLYTDEESQEKTVTVPDFSGMSVTKANSTAASYGLNIQLSGLSSDSSEAFAAGQSIAPGTKVMRGTVVKVEFLYDSQDD
ncbi:MAG: PASTA domain-containing protein [Clostridia bacterium]|nr:PASTA domain-containing protein [Clostridia bacterium]